MRFEHIRTAGSSEALEVVARIVKRFESDLECPEGICLRGAQR